MIRIPAMARSGGAVGRRLLATLAMLGFALQMIAMPHLRALDGAPSAASATTPHYSAITNPDTQAGILLTDEEMAQVVGAGFWSSFWEGVKEWGTVVVIFGIVWLVNDFCQNPQVSCSFAE